MLRRWSIGTWLMAIGCALGIAGGIPFVWLISSGQPTDLSSTAELALAASGGVLLLACLIFVVGLALYVLLPAFDPPRARRDYGSHRVVLACLALAIVISLVLQAGYMVTRAMMEPGFQIGNLSIGLRGSAEQMISPLGLVVAAVTLELSLLGVLWVRVIRPGAITWSRMGLSGSNLGSKVLYGFATGVAIMVAAAAVQWALGQFGVEQTQVQLFGPIKQASPFEFALMLLAAGPLAAFVEESFFRGYVFQGYLEQKGPWQAFLLSSAIFGIVHIESGGLPVFPPVFAIGLVLAFVYNRTRSVVPTMIGHAINNTIAFSALYFGLG